MNFATFTEDDYKIIEKERDILFETAGKRCPNDEEFAIVKKAFDFANEAHKNVRRRSGEPYILHPIAVARIVVDEIGLGYKSIVTALLHDVVEDTEYTVEDICNLFGEKVASLVDGLTKIKTVLDNENRTKNTDFASQSLQAENLKRILLTLNDDVRVVLIKLADRLHNCRTIEYMPEHKRDKILSETMYIFIPLAHRLGLYGIKSEMENIWLKYREPEEYKYISERIEHNVEERAKEIDEFVAPIEKLLKDSGYDFTVKKRIKTPYSVWHKMKAKNVSFEEIYDLYAVRIIYVPKDDSPNSERDQAYLIYSSLLSLYHENPGRRRDWISQPKTNGYEALHCTLMSHSGIWMEVQIRSRRMDDIAEKGIAAHWAYKAGGYVTESENEMDKWLAKVKQILDSKDVGALELLDIIHKDLVTNDIVVFTPKGDQKTIQTGATALDFAYMIHTHIGEHAIAAKINMKLASLSQVLKAGDQVEIITTNAATPKTEWLSFLQTHHASRLVYEYIKENRPEELQTADKFYNSNGKKKTEQGRVVEKDGCRYIIAECCRPIPGDPVIGFRNPDGSVTVHKKYCHIAESIASKHGESVVVPNWVVPELKDFLVKIEIKGIDRVGLLNDMTRKISRQMGINMRSLQLGCENGLFEGSIELLVKDRKVFEELLDAIRTVDGISEVVRTD